MAKTGKLTLQQTSVSGGIDGLFNNGGLLNVAHSTISGNSDCGISSAYFDPQLERGSSGQSNISNSIVSSNTGCGMSASYTRLGISNSTISNNGGNGVFVDYSGARIVNSTISSNGGSGVIVDASSFAAIINSTITRNAGSEGFGNVPPPSAKVGGGVYAGLESGASILNSTISGNAADVGAGLYVSTDRGSAEVTNSTITGNTATAQGGGISTSYYLELKGAIVSGNTAPQGREVFTGRGQYVTAGRFNLFGFNGSSGVEGFSPGITDIVPSQPLGAILNHALPTMVGLLKRMP